MALLELTSVYENINNIKRNLFFDETLTLKFKRQNTTLLEIETGWYVQKEPTSSINDKVLGSPAGYEEFFECSIAIDDEDLDLESIIKLSDSVEIGNEKFVTKQYIKPRAATKKWNLRLVTLGKK